MGQIAPVGFTDSETFYSGDSRQLRFHVTDDGDARDITDDDLSWYLIERPHGALDGASVDDATEGVSIVTDPVTDPTEGEFQVRIDEGVTGELWGQFYQVARVDGAGDTRQSWRGEVILEAIDDPDGNGNGDGG